MLSFEDFILEKRHEPMTFIRYGGLSPVKQKGFGKDTFHSPPARNGFYAFVQGAMDTFLIGSSVFDARRMEQVKKPSQIKKVLRSYDTLDLDQGSKAFQVWRKREFKNFFDDNYDNMTDDEIEAYRNDHMVWAKHISPKHFTHNGDLWSHLEEYVKDKTSIKKRTESWILTDYKTWLQAYLIAKRHLKRENFTKDHLEVFIERIQNFQE